MNLCLCGSTVLSQSLSFKFKRARDHVMMFRVDYVRNTLPQRGSNVELVENLTTGPAAPAREFTGAHRVSTATVNQPFSLVLGHCDNEPSSPPTPPPIHSPTSHFNIQQPAQPLERSQQTTPTGGSTKGCESRKESIPTASPSECEGSATLPASCHSG
jgi:hypothetical protein